MENNSARRKNLTIFLIIALVVLVIVLGRIFVQTPQPAVDIQPAPVFNLFGNPNLPVTNTLITTWIAILIIVAMVYAATRRRDLIPRGFQNFAEWGVEGILNLVEGVSGKEKGRKFFPLVATFFFFILVANMIDILPGIDTIGTINHASSAVAGFLLVGDNADKLIPWFRPPTSDLNLTFAMALVSVVVTQIFGFYALGARVHLGKYFKFKELFTHGFQGPIEFFVGLVELITEVSRILSFAFRLFGNIFAGGAVLALFAFLLPFIGDVIFIPLEIFVALVQALVFALLSLVFLEMATSSHEHTESEHEAHEEFAQNEEKRLASTH